MDSLTQVAVERPRRQKRLDPELEQLPSRCGHLALRMVGQNLLDHETPIAVRPVVGVGFGRVIMRSHIQGMLHCTVSPKGHTGFLFLSLNAFTTPLTSRGVLLTHMPCALLVKLKTSPRYEAELTGTRPKVPNSGASVVLACEAQLRVHVGLNFCC